MSSIRLQRWLLMDSNLSFGSTEQKLGLILYFEMFFVHEVRCLTERNCRS